jgi:hypothetical protein
MTSVPEREPPMPVELTEEQRKVLEAREGSPVEIVDPQTHRSYVLLAREQYERIRSLVEIPAGEKTEPPIPEGIRRSQEAFWRDLPQLLTQKKLIGKWVCYCGDERIGIGRYEDLIRECVRRGIRDDAYDLAIIEPHHQPPWDEEEVEPLGPQHFDDVPSHA